MFQRHHRSFRVQIPFWYVLLLCLPIVGCSRDTWLKLYGHDRTSLLKENLPPEDEALARDCVELLLQGRYDEIEARMDPSIRNADTHQMLAEMSSYFWSRPTSVKTVEAGIVGRGDSGTTNITLEYQFQAASRQSWLLAHLVIQKKAGIKTITTFRIMPTPESFEAMNEFTFADKGFSQYAGLLLALSVGAITLYAFVLCVRMRIGTRKWIWLVAIVVGVSRITVNWTTGQWFFTPLAVQVPPVTPSCTAYGPWMLEIFSPLGAIAFLRVRKRLEIEELPLTVVADAEAANEISS